MSDISDNDGEMSQENVTMDLISFILNEVLQRGYLDINHLMKMLQSLTGSKEAYFFQVSTTSAFTCVYSSDDDKFKVDAEYEVEHLPDQRLNIFILTSVVAALHLSNPSVVNIDNLHNPIAIALHFQQTMSSNLNLMIQSSLELMGRLSQMSLKFEEQKIIPHSESENQNIYEVRVELARSLNIMRDVRDYAALVSNKFRWELSDFNIRIALDRAMKASKIETQRITITNDVPRIIEADERRFMRSVVLPFMQSFKNQNVTIVIDSETISIAKGILYIYIHGRVPAEIIALTNSLYVDAEHLSLHVARKMCEQTGGYVRIEDSHGTSSDDPNFMFCFGFTFSKEDNVLRNKHVILFLHDSYDRDRIFRLLDDIGAFVTIFNESDSALYMKKIGTYDVAIMDELYAETYLQRAQDNYLGVIGIDARSQLPFDAFVTDEERSLLDAYKKIMERKQ